MRKNNLKFNFYGISWDLDLCDKITILDCNSGAGKTMMMDSLEELAVLPEFSYIKVFNYKTVRLLSELNKCKDNLIFIDNGELLLTPEVNNAIFFDTTNQFVIAARDLKGLEISLYDFKKPIYEKESRTFRLEAAYAEVLPMD